MISFFPSPKLVHRCFLLSKSFMDYPITFFKFVVIAGSWSRHELELKNAQGCEIRGRTASDCGSVLKGKCSVFWGSGLVYAYRIQDSEVLHVEALWWMQRLAWASTLRIGGGRIHLSDVWMNAFEWMIKQTWMSLSEIFLISASAERTSISLPFSSLLWWALLESGWFYPWWGNE